MEEYMKQISLSKIGFLFVAILLVLTVGMKAYGDYTPEDVDYKKWSRLAISSVKEKYPAAELSDYKYMGREEVNEEESKDTFHIKCIQNEKSFIVKVDIVFNPVTGKLITVNIEELIEDQL